MPEGHGDNRPAGWRPDGCSVQMRLNQVWFDDQRETMFRKELLSQAWTSTRPTQPRQLAQKLLCNVLGVKWRSRSLLVSARENASRPGEESVPIYFSARADMPGLSVQREDRFSRT